MCYKPHDELVLWGIIPQRSKVITEIMGDHISQDVYRERKEKNRGFNLECLHHFHWKAKKKQTHR
jgi:hypothetical protein